MSTNEPIEITATTVDEAIKQALEQLAAQEDDVVIEVLATPRAGVLGLGARQARVRVTRRTSNVATSGVQSPLPAPAADRHPPGPAAGQARDEQERPQAQAEAVALNQLAQEAREVLIKVLALMDERAEVLRTQGDPESVELEIKGDGSGILIGRHGQTLDALEYLVNRIVARRIRDAAP